MPGTTNFQQFNPTQANAESDAAYTSDALRSGGLTTSCIVPGNLANKLFYQTTTFVAAFAQMIDRHASPPCQARPGILKPRHVSLRCTVSPLTLKMTGLPSIKQVPSYARRSARASRIANPNRLLAALLPSWQAVAFCQIEYRAQAARRCALQRHPLSWYLN